MSIVPKEASPLLILRRKFTILSDDYSFGRIIMMLAVVKGRNLNGLTGNGLVNLVFKLMVVLDVINLLHCAL